MEYQELLDLIEHYIIDVCLDEDNEQLMKIFTWVHGVNKNNSCHNSHLSWEEDAKKCLSEYLRKVT